MSLNKFMHVRNIYKSPPDFNDLAHQYPEFEKYISRKSNGKIIFDFKNPEALRCLTLILLKRDFGLELTIPENKLIPTLPLRLNYILWLEDLLNWTPEAETRISGVDVGTGATCIYPLLAAKKNGWKMMATEINASSVETANHNVKQNSLEHLITVKEVFRSTFLSGAVNIDDKYDFCMCNPPFFNYDADICENDNAAENTRSNDDFFSDQTNEIQSAGGEVEFVKNIIQDSLKIRNQIKIYTSMIGQKSSLTPLLLELKKCGIKSVSQTEFCQGRTVRWAVAWTHTEETLKQYSPLTQFKLPKPITWLFEAKFSFHECAGLVIPQLLSQLKIEHVILEDFKKRKLWRIIAVEDTWTGSRKKRREQSRSEKVATMSAEVLNETERSPIRPSTEISIADPSENSSGSVSPKFVKKDRNTFFNMKPKIKESCPKTNYCRLYVLSEKRKSTEEIDAPLKKVKLDDGNSSLPKCHEECVLQALLSVKSMQCKIELQILYERGQKDAPQRILQFLKNNLA